MTETVWDDLVGQEQLAAQLAEAATEPRAMTHAWLFVGPAGSGRSTAALAFAAALQDPSARIDSSEVKAVLAGTHPDVTLVSTEAVILRAEVIRPLIELAQRTPARGRWRIIIIEDADRLNETSGNVLLKAIEEPPERTVWLLCAPSAADVLTTVRSRSRVVSLRTPAPEQVAQLLQQRDGIDADTAAEVARISLSHVGVARRLATDPKARARRQQVLELASQINDAADAIVVAGEIVETVKQEAESLATERNEAEQNELLRIHGVEPGATVPRPVATELRTLKEEQKRRDTRATRDQLDRALLDLISLYRDVLVTQLAPGQDIINTDFAETVRYLAGSSTSAQTLTRITAIEQARARLARNVAPLLAIEALSVELAPSSS